MDPMLLPCYSLHEVLLLEETKKETKKETEREREQEGIKGHLTQS
jgi:hypothetical protein